VGAASGSAGLAGVGSGPLAGAVPAAGAGAAGSPDGAGKLPARSRDRSREGSTGDGGDGEAVCEPLVSWPAWLGDSEAAGCCRPLAGDGEGANATGGGCWTGDGEEPVGVAGAALADAPPDVETGAATPAGTACAVCAVPGADPGRGRRNTYQTPAAATIKRSSAAAINRPTGDRLSPTATAARTCGSGGAGTLVGGAGRAGGGGIDGVVAGDAGTVPRVKGTGGGGTAAAPVVLRGRA
jgi:hypothetical protein